MAVNSGPGPLGVAITPDGKSVYVTNEFANAVRQFSVGTGGALSVKSPATVQSGVNPDGIAVSPDGKSAYVTSINDNTVWQYDIDPQSGTLVPKSPATVATGEGAIGDRCQPAAACARRARSSARTEAGGTSRSSRTRGSASRSSTTARKRRAAGLRGSSPETTALDEKRPAALHGKPGSACTRAPGAAVPRAARGLPTFPMAAM